MKSMHWHHQLVLILLRWHPSPLVVTTMWSHITPLGSESSVSRSPCGVRVELQQQQRRWYADHHSITGIGAQCSLSTQDGSQQ